MPNDKISNLYNTFVSDGYDMESEEDFRNNLTDPHKRRSAYDALVKDGYEMEPFEEFEINIGFGSNTNSEGSVARQVAAESGNNYNPEAGKGSDPTLNNTGRISPPSSPYVTGKGTDVRVFDVPYNDYIAMSPQQQSEVYQKAIDKKRLKRMS